MNVLAKLLQKELLKKAASLAGPLAAEEALYALLKKRMSAEARLELAERLEVSAKALREGRIRDAAEVGAQIIGDVKF